MDILDLDRKVSGVDRDDSDVLIADGTLARIRDLTPDDLTAVQQLHEQASDRSIYLRFFSLNRELARQYAAELVQPATGDHRALGAFVGSALLGVAVYERASGTSAEFAVLVGDQAQHTGIGTLLLEHLAVLARRAGIDTFVADVLAENARMIEVYRTLGYPAQTVVADDVLEVRLDIGAAQTAADAIAHRERTADEASLQPLLAPRSVVVVGASPRTGNVGHALLSNIRTGGFTGELYAVNPHGGEIDGLSVARAIAELPGPVDLAVLAVPADAVPGVLAQCGAIGCRAAIVVASGFGEVGGAGRSRQDEVLEVARRHGIRLVGPNCLGVLNTDPAVRLNATFAKGGTAAGPLALAAQSGAFGAGMITAANAAGLGVSQFVSLGNKVDIGGNDLLPAWRDDPRVGVVALYLESVGDPRRFARIARDVARVKPVLAVKSGRTEVGRRAGQSHTAAAASSDAAVDALLRGSGVVRVAGMPQLLAAARVLATQPAPTGPRVAIVGNSGGPQILAADAAAEAGLQVPEFAPHTRAVLSELGLAQHNPVDLGAAATPDTLAAVLHSVHADPGVDAVLTVFAEIAVTDIGGIRAAIARAAAASGKTSVGVEVGAAGFVLPADDRGRAVPVFGFPEPAAQALGVAWRSARIRLSPPDPPARPDGVDRAAASSLVDAALERGGGWLTAEQVAALLDHYGIPRCRQDVVHSAELAVEAAAELGYPVVLKLAQPGLHKSDVGGVRVGLADPGAVYEAAIQLLALGGAGVAGLLVQPMVDRGTELIAGAVHDAQFGPLVLLGAGGTLTEIVHDRSLRLAPLSQREAAEMIDELRSSRLLDGYRGAPPVSRAAVADVLVRVAALADDIPQIAEMDLNPLLCRGDDVIAVDARVRVATPPWHPDPLMRRLRGPVTPAATTPTGAVT